MPASVQRFTRDRKGPSWSKASLTAIDARNLRNEVSETASARTCRLSTRQRKQVWRQGERKILGHWRLVEAQGHLCTHLARYDRLLSLPFNTFSPSFTDGMQGGGHDDPMMVFNL